MSLFYLSGKPRKIRRARLVKAREDTELPQVVSAGEFHPPTVPEFIRQVWVNIDALNLTPNPVSTWKATITDPDRELSNAMTMEETAAAKKAVEEIRSIRREVIRAKVPPGQYGRSLPTDMGVKFYAKFFRSTGVSDYQKWRNAEALKQIVAGDFRGEVDKAVFEVIQTAAIVAAKQDQRAADLAKRNKQLRAQNERAGVKKLRPDEANKKAFEKWKQDVLSQPEYQAVHPDAVTLPTWKAWVDSPYYAQYNAASYMWMPGLISNTQETQAAIDGPKTWAATPSNNWQDFGQSEYNQLDKPPRTSWDSHGVEGLGSLGMRPTNQKYLGIALAVVAVVAVGLIIRKK